MVKTTANKLDGQNLTTDVVFLRNIGFALFTLTFAVGAIIVVGVLKTSQLLSLAFSQEASAPAADLLLHRIGQEISLLEEMQPLTSTQKPYE